MTYSTFRWTISQEKFTLTSRDLLIHRPYAEVIPLTQFVEQLAVNSSQIEHRGFVVYFSLSTVTATTQNSITVVGCYASTSRQLIEVMEFEQKGLKMLQQAAAAAAVQCTPGQVYVICVIIITSADSQTDRQVRCSTQSLRSILHAPATLTACALVSASCHIPPHPRSPGLMV